MTQTELVFVLLAWLGTYLVHSTLLLGGTWLLTKRVLRTPRLRERAWRVAMVGGFLTASLQVGLGRAPILGHLELVATQAEFADAPSDDERSQDEPVTALESRSSLVTLPALTRPLPDAVTESPEIAFGARKTTPGVRDRAPTAEPRRSAPAPIEITADVESEPEVALAPRIDAPFIAAADGEAPFGPRAVIGASQGAREFHVVPRAVSWKTVVVVTWVLVGGLGLLAFAWAWSRLVRRLSDRREIVAGPLRAQLDTLCEAAGMRRRVRLFASAKLVSPISHGWIAPRISIPLRALTDLAPNEQASMLGHELAHAKRSDPLWFSIYSLFERVLFFQPLNRFARRELHEIAEMLCDDWAVRWMGGGRLALASCLTEIAQWIVGRKRAALLSPGMAGHKGSQLGARVERLLDDRKSPEPEPRHRWWPPVALSSLFITFFAAPGVSSTIGAPEPLARTEFVAPESVAIGEPTSPAPRSSTPAPVRALLLDQELLDAEIDELRAELAAIRAGLAPANRARFESVLDRVERKIESLHERRERLETLLSLVLKTSVPNHVNRRASRR